LLNGTLGSISIQSGYGANGTTVLDLARELMRSIGNGTFSAPATSVVAGIWNGAALQLQDLNGDGNIDVIL